MGSARSGPETLAFLRPPCSRSNTLLLSTYQSSLNPTPAPSPTSSQPSLAVLSKRIHQYETPIRAAKRGLEEELARKSSTWVYLGRYRTDANRGGGYVSCYLARSTEPIPGKEPAKTNDLETYTLLQLSRRQMREALLRNRFLEAKWALTVSLALLRLDLDRWDALQPEGLGVQGHGLEEGAEPAAKKQPPAAAAPEAPEARKAAAAPPPEAPEAPLRPIVLRKVVGDPEAAVVPPPQ